MEKKTVEREREREREKEREREREEQCDQIGRFFKDLGDKFITKVAQMIVDFLGNFKNPHSCVKTAAATFWATFGNVWATFYSKIWSHWRRSVTTIYKERENKWKSVYEPTTTTTD